MSQLATRHSPIHHLLEARGADFHEVGDACFAVRLQSAEVEAAAKERLAICDLSGLRKLGLKGRDAEQWLQDQGIDVPANIYDTAQLVDGALVARIGAAEFFLEESIDGTTIQSLCTAAQSHGGELYCVEHADATFLLMGSRSSDVFAQTCGVDFRTATTRQVIYTRVAGVSCGILPDSTEVPNWRIWTDPSFAEYLWETLVDICESLDGQVVGAGSAYPQLLA